MPGQQRAKSFKTPPRWMIPWISRAHVWLYRRSGGKMGSSGAGMRQLLLRTVGRRSGKEHTVCLPYWLDAGGHRVVVASFAGARRSPAWYHNAADATANAEVWVMDRERRFWARPDVLDGADRDEVWRSLTADRPFYADYQARTDRQIPLVRLVELRPA